MANDSTITFDCPACGIRLTVPGNLAGISGPCPSCGKPIQAPINAEGASDLAVKSPPVSAPEDVVSEPPVEAAARSVPAPPHSMPASDEFAGVCDHAAAAVTADLRLDPSWPPNPRSRLEPSPKLASEGVGGDLDHAAVVQTGTTISTRIIRILLPLVFILLIVAVVFAILRILASRSDDTPFFERTPFPSRTPAEPESSAEQPPPAAPTPNLRN